MDTQIGTRPQIGALEIHQAYIYKLEGLMPMLLHVDTVLKAASICT